MEDCAIFNSFNNNNSLFAVEISDPHFMQHMRVFETNLQSCRKKLFGKFRVVGYAVFQSNV